MPERLRGALRVAASRRIRRRRLKLTFSSFLISINSARLFLRGVSSWLPVGCPGAYGNVTLLALDSGIVYLGSKMILIELTATYGGSKHLNENF